MRLIAIVLGLACLLVTGRPAAADGLVFQSPPVNNTQCPISDYSGGQVAAAKVLLSGPDLWLTRVRWWGAYGQNPDPAVDNFVIRFYRDSGGWPGFDYFYEQPVTVTRTPTNMTALPWGVHDGGPVYEYWATLPVPLDVIAGRTYYLAAVNFSTSSWGWLEGGPGVYWADIGSGWILSPHPNYLSFELFAVPEPASLVLLCAPVLLRRR